MLLPLQDESVGVEQQRLGPDVEPAALDQDATQIPPLGERREHHPLEGQPAPGVLLQRPALQYVDAGVDGLGGFGAQRRLLDERLDHVVRRR